MSKPGVFGRIKHWFSKVYAKFLRLHLVLRILVVFVLMVAFMGVGAGIAALTSSSSNFGAAEQQTTSKSDALPTASRPSASNSVPGNDNTTEEEKTETTQPQQQPQQSSPTNIGSVPTVTEPAVPTPTFSVAASAVSVSGQTLSFTLTVTREGGFSASVTGVTFDSSPSGITCSTTYADTMNVVCTVPDGITTGSVIATVATSSKSASATANF
ncbi:MAG: hypothetical protein WBP26_01435 [Candidatus Saccharimonadales bacterium]